MTKTQGQSNILILTHRAIGLPYASRKKQKIFESIIDVLSAKSDKSTPF